MYLVMRLRCSRRKVQEALFDLFGLDPSVGLIAQPMLEVYGPPRPTTRL